MFSKKDLDLIKRLEERKHISLPNSTQRMEFDLTRFLPIINHPLFQRLKYLTQLANADKVFPGATHTRFIHSIDTAYWQAGRNKFWLEYGMIDQDTADLLLVFALLHDLPHGPFSHTLDRVCTVYHDQRTVGLVASMQKEIEECVSFTGLVDLLEERNPIYQSVKHHPLGTDKFSYLTLDSTSCGVGAPNLAYLPNYVFWIDKHLMVGAMCAQEALELKRFYINMYKQVYFRPACLIKQRILEKIIFFLLNSGSLKESVLWDMTDNELVREIQKTKCGREQYRKYQYEDPDTLLTFKLQGYGLTEAEKSFSTIEREMRFFNTLIKQSNPKTLEQKERELAKLLGVNHREIHIVPPMGTDRFIPKPLMIVNGLRTYQDKSVYPKNHEALKELADNSLAIRVCAWSNITNLVAGKIPLIIDFFDDWVNKSKKP